jgi:hypothetical protein
VVVVETHLAEEQDMMVVSVAVEVVGSSILNHYKILHK